MTPLPPHPISVKALAARFGKGLRWAGVRMRQMQHVRQGRDLFTTEQWLAEWLVRESIPAINWPPKNQRWDPLERACWDATVALVGRLADEGKIRAFRDSPEAA